MRILDKCDRLFCIGLCLVLLFPLRSMHVERAQNRLNLLKTALTERSLQRRGLWEGSDNRSGWHLANCG